MVVATSFKDICSSLLFSYAIGAPPPPPSSSTTHRPHPPSWMAIPMFHLMAQNRDQVGCKAWEDGASRGTILGRSTSLQCCSKHKVTSWQIFVITWVFITCCKLVCFLWWKHEQHAWSLWVSSKMLLQCYVFRICLILLEDLAVSDGYLLRPMLICCIPILFFAPLFF
jgi:hypothetical protein